MPTPCAKRKATSATILEEDAADLSFYRDEIVDIVALPEPGQLLLLVSGLAALAVLSRRREQ